MNNQQEITLVLIVKNEELHLRNCLESSKKLWNKLLIVDTGSTDRTLEIATEFNAEIKHFQWQDDFSAARNFALSNVRTPWIFTLDADDIIESQDAEELARQLPDLQNNFDLIILPYIYAGTKNNPKTTHLTARFWKADLCLAYKRTVHEILDLTPQTPKQNTEIRRHYSAIPIIHNKQISHLSSINRNIELLLQAYQKDPNDLASLLYLAFENECKKDLFNAAKFYQEFLSKEKTDRLNLAIANTKLGIIKLQLGENSSSKSLFEKAIILAPELIEAYLYLAEMEIHLGSIPRAIQLLNTAKQLPPPKLFSIDNLHLYENYAEDLLTLANHQLNMKKK